MSTIIYLLLDRLINKTDSDLLNFDPVMMSMSDLNASAITILQAINKSEELKEVYETPEKKLELSPLLKELNSVKPTN
jgi:hypothetical protein